MPKKSTRYVLKVYVLYEASTGYVMNWTLHTGELEGSDLLIRHKIVMKLVKGLEGELHMPFID